MSQAIVDPAELRHFAQHLRQFNGDLRERVAFLRAQMHGLGDTWRDQEHARFVQEFEQTMNAIEAFSETSEQHIPFLLRKAERIEDYLNQK
jgi:uncharacterized protein YukE